MILLILLGSLSMLVQGYNSVAANWTSDVNFQAGTFILLNSQTKAPYDNTFTLTFASAMVTNPPAFTFGIKSY
jgi:hypothetical protein